MFVKVSTCSYVSILTVLVSSVYRYYYYYNYNTTSTSFMVHSFHKAGLKMKYKSKHILYVVRFVFSWFNLSYILIYF